MAKLLPALLLLCLLLCGCGQQTAADHTAHSPEPAQALSGESRPILGAPESQFDGALRICTLGISEVTGLRAFGNSLVVFSGSQNTTLTLLGGRELACETSIQLPFPLDPQDPSLRLENGQLSYYDPLRKLTVLLDGSLEEIAHIPAPEALQGQPILSTRYHTLYYCAQDGIYAWDQESGLRRRIKEMAFPGQHLTGLALDDTVLQCQLPEGDSERNLLVSAQTGQLLDSQNRPFHLSSFGGSYYASFPDGLGQILLCGEIGGKPRLFLPAGTASTCSFLERQAGAVTITAAPEGGQTLDYYSLTSGQRLSSLPLEPGKIPITITDTSDGNLTVLIQDSQDNSFALCRWDVGPASSLAVQDPAQYVFPYHTAADPEPKALAECQAYASRLDEKYGIEIRIGTDAVLLRPWNYTLKPEVQPAILWRELSLLEERLAQFPSHILTDTAAHFSSLKLCIVRQLTGTAESGSFAQAAGTQFLSGTDAYVVIASGPYSEQALYNSLFHVMETHILTNSSAFDQWDTLNPQAFSYSYHTLLAEQDPDPYLTGENRAFIDAHAMTFPKEDRASVFESAMRPGNRDTFQPWILQRKLITICKGIREAYGLEKSPEAYPWEQYLHTSLAYHK